MTEHEITTAAHALADASRRGRKGAFRRALRPWVAPAVTLVALVFTIGFAVGVGVQSTRTPSNHLPSCPTEDSCTVDYRDGAWHIEEVQP